MSLPKIYKPDEGHHLNCLFYGATGVGKTQLSGTAARYAPTSPTLFIDVEGGVITLRGTDVDVVRPTSWSDIQEIYDHLREEDHGYQSVVVDSVTEVQRMLSLGFIMGDLAEGEDGYADLGKTTPPDRQDWLRTGEQMRKFMRAFRDLAWQEDEDRRVHVIMTALEKHDERNRTVCPDLSGKLGMGAGAFFDILGRLSVVEVDTEEGVEARRHLLVSHYEDDGGTKYLAKNRGGRLGRSIWNPTIEAVLSAWDEEEQETQLKPGKQKPEPVEDATDDENPFDD